MKKNTGKILLGTIAAVALLTSCNKDRELKDDYILTQIAIANLHDELEDTYKQLDNQANTMVRNTQTYKTYDSLRNVYSQNPETNYYLEQKIDSLEERITEEKSNMMLDLANSDQHVERTMDALEYHYDKSEQLETALLRSDSAKNIKFIQQNSVLKSR
jgi:hypothetical protein